MGPREARWLNDGLAILGTLAHLLATEDHATFDAERALSDHRAIVSELQTRLARNLPTHHRWVQ